MKKMGVQVCFLVAALLCLCYADIYMHNPRGSNNRLNEATATRNTNNRMFDSQNNARGGYNIGDKTDKAAGSDPNKQYQMQYFMSGENPQDVTELLIEWTNQHGCGANEKVNCDVVIQYMDQEASAPTNKDKIRDGTTRARQDYQNNPNEQNNRNTGERKFTESQASYNNRKNNNVKSDRGYHEPHEWYDNCRSRFRNNGLFTADQNVQQNRATHTRQNANGNRNGYECAEERDHFPYWHPTPWKDVAVFTKNVSRCAFYKRESFNVKPKGECVEKWPETNNDRHYSSANTKALCEKAGGTWTEFHNYVEIVDRTQGQCAGNLNGNTLKWGIPYRLNGNNRRAPACMALLKAPDCAQTGFSRQNHLGNSINLEPLRYNWKLPSMSKNKKFVLRIRYNISTDDYDPHNTDSSLNGDKSPVKGNPYVDIGANAPLQLAINTAQFFRTFEDRSHVSRLDKRPNGLTSGRIVNLNVRGKRGNIVQTFPAVEYDFIPNKLNISRNDHVHIQWTGSNTHNNGGNGGDGDTGDAGQGTGGTDRSNIAGMNAKDDNFPSAMENSKNLCHKMNVIWQAEGKTSSLMSWSDICVKLGSSGYYNCVSGCTNSLDVKAKMNNLLNNAPATFPGMVVKFKETGDFHYMSTRNNAFTNRSQKGSFFVR